MTNRLTFLHVTDPHLSNAGVPFVRDDRKVLIPGIEPDTREDMLEQLFARLAEYIRAKSRTLDGVIFSGDAQDRGAPGGHERVLELILRHLGPLGISPTSIVATPGNHDIPRDSKPGSIARYDDFNKVWRNGGCVVPWLDGIDAMPIADARRHRLVASDKSWAIYPINSSNWSHVTSILPAPLGEVWDAIPETVAPDDASRAAKIRGQLQALARYDMARLSNRQLEALRSIISTTGMPDHGCQLRIAVMHHHLRSPSLREELKPFADISNLEQVRTFLRDSRVGVVLHGHKHEHAAYFDHLYDDAGDQNDRTLVISGATFASGQEVDAMRLVAIDGLPHTPTVTIEPLPLPRAGVEWRPGSPITKRLWVEIRKPSGPVVVTPGTPMTIEGSDIDEVYARACKAASHDASRGILVVHLDLPEDSTELPLPAAYPYPEDLEGDDRQTWLKDLVVWWQLDRSQLEHRMPYIHGGRLRRYGGKIDQVERIITLLRSKESTRAVAVLVDPFRDFNLDPSNEDFASFCLVEFRRRTIAGGRPLVDAVAFYRAQEFARWWPVNVAELRMLQLEITTALKFRPGRITTIAADARTIARSPTQVAMPIIDRWLDQAPERLHLLADALVHRSSKDGAHGKAAREWLRGLAELRASTKEFNDDGVPVAIEGLRILAAYVSVAANTGDAEAHRLVNRLRALADHNETYEKTKREFGDFKLWSATATTLVDELESLTKGRIAGVDPTL